jgi:ubiquinone/menaquinone biosynthesis C-methylase UbiE
MDEPLKTSHQLADNLKSTKFFKKIEGRYMKSYLIQDLREHERLDFQNKIDVYDLNLELNFFSWDPKHRILDAGCGHGNVIGKLLEKGIEKVQGIDFCPDRVSLAQERFRHNPMVIIKQGSLDATGFESGSFDVVICRYVFEHLLNHEEVLGELYRILKPYGILRIINFDGLLFNFHTKNDKLNRQLAELKQRFTHDFDIGRKLPQLLNKQGFDKVEWEAESYFFKGDRLKLEHQNYKMRFEQARPHLSKYFSSGTEYDSFARVYLEEMLDECNVLAASKFFITGQKKSLKVVK